MTTKRKRRPKKAEILPQPAGGITVDEYNDVVRAAELAHIALIHVEFDLAPQALPAKRSDLRFSYDVEISEPRVAADGTASAVFSWWVSAIKMSEAGPQEGGAKPIVSAKAQWLAIYTGLAGKPHTGVSAFLSNVGKFATYPYFRALVSQLSWSSGVNLPVMPIFRE